MNVFITGASGFIGRRLLEYISADRRFEKVYCLCRSNVDLPSDFTVIHGSLDELENLPPIDADVCIHLAAVTDSTVADSNEDFDVFNINSDGTASVVEFCKKSNISKIVFLSSVNVYLKEKYTYALSKLAAEEHIKNSGLEYSILRCALVYGKGCKSFDKIIKFAKSLHIVPVLGNGKAYEQPIYIDEVCQAIISYTIVNGESLTCDLYGKTKLSYNEMVRQLAQAIDTKVFLLHFPIAPIVFVSEFCYKHNIPFPIQPEQISHMCEDLCGRNNDEQFAVNYELDDFAVNLRKYIK